MLQHAERRRRQSAHDGYHPDDDQVLTFKQWCEVNTFSVATGKRIKASGKGPIFTQLSTNRVGVTRGNNRRWQQSRACGA
jgi:hypothetical protein